jgi:hypothetical protein
MRAPLAAAVRRLSRGLFVFGVLLSLASAAAGLDPQTALTQYGHTAWRVRDGVFAGSPSALAQTADGFLWIGADAGLIRFDGVRFTPWEPPPGARLPDEHIVSLLASRDGSLWIGTAKGLARWQGGRLTVYAHLGRFGALIEDRHGTIWAGHTRVVPSFPPSAVSRRGNSAVSASRRRIGSATSARCTRTGRGTSGSAARPASAASGRRLSYRRRSNATTSRGWERWRGGTASS